jgi:hypothetical protein
MEHVVEFGGLLGAAELSLLSISFEMSGVIIFE